MRKTKLREEKFGFSLMEMSLVILILAVLAAGVSKGSRLISQSKIKNAQKMTVNSPVVSMYGIALWLDATDSKTISVGTVASNSYSGYPMNGDAVVKWKDHNPHNSNPIELSAPADINRPTYVTKGINGLPTLRFDGNTDYFVNNIKGLITPGNPTYTMFAVWRPFALLSPSVIFAQHSQSFSSGSIAGMNLDPTFVYPGFWGLNSASYDFYSSNSNMAITNNKPNIQGVRVNTTRSSDIITVYLNGNSQSGSPSLIPSIGDGKIMVGAGDGGSGPDFYVNGYISEIIVFDRALTEVEVGDVKSYLAKKYGIQINQ